ncbi:disintegrin and metalloproteinase domain-containing protein 32-like [Eulemur rufifrons]|uniref:disintegrin and metalloproteinase domain-containing protein 32-like n=1 Tax=Eulemur rufifrons TaxID=859984 RepID=UPI003741F8F1
MEAPAWEGGSSRRQRPPFSHRLEPRNRSMFHLLLLLLLLAGLWGLPAARPGFQNSFLQIIVPEKIQTDTNGTSEINNEQISYIIPINERPYTVHLKQRYFIADNFMVYLYNQGSVNSHSSNTETQCYYQGNIEGYPNSVVSLNMCPGLRGILQFENVSYGIEPLESAIEFQHLLYKLGKENNEFSIFNNDNRSTEQYLMDYKIFISEKLESDIPDLFPLYLEIHIVVDKALYDYLGSDSIMITKKVFEIVGLVNSMFTEFKITVVLSSLEFWSDKNKISTVGGADELLYRFLKWKQSYLTLRPHDIAYLFMYRDYPNYVGATFHGKMCVTHYSAGIALYPKESTLEAFSVVVTQLLALSLGLSYDDPKKCRCSKTTCIMNPNAMKSSGVKRFSSCSLSDFKHFTSHVGTRCLQNKPPMQWQRKSVCGNKKVEGDEVCDCGTAEQCGPDSCCDPQNCMLKQGAQCHEGSCCRNCQIASAGVVCRPQVHVECDISEFCNGSSPECGPDITIHNGHGCRNNTLVCFSGECPDPDQRCESIFGRGSRQAPFACYEEIQSQGDSFGNCGLNRGRYVYCAWNSLICGRLVCTYPTQAPFYPKMGNVIYAFVRGTVCITLDHPLHLESEDPMIMQDGTACDTGRICRDHSCIESRFIKSESEACSQKCSGHGVCNSQKQCNCTDGYLPPNCQLRARGSPLVPEGQGSIMERASRKTKKTWLLGFYIFLPVLIVTTMVALAWNRLKKRFTTEEESLSSKSKSQESIQTHSSRCVRSLLSLTQDQLWTVGRVPPPVPAQRAWLAAGSFANSDVCPSHLPPDHSLGFCGDTVFASGIIPSHSGLSLYPSPFPWPLAGWPTGSSPEDREAASEGRRELEF